MISVLKKQLLEQIEKLNNSDKFCMADNFLELLSEVKDIEQELLLIKKQYETIKKRGEMLGLV